MLALALALLVARDEHLPAVDRHGNRLGAAGLVLVVVGMRKA